MLDALLQLAAEGGPLTASEAARRLGVSQTMTQLLFEELARRGYLAAPPTTCRLPCESCAVRDACGAGRQARLWVLTAKGARAAAPSRGAVGAGDRVSPGPGA